MIPLSDEKKIVFEDNIVCPHCKKRVIVKREKKTIVAPEKGEYEEITIVEKDKQKTLEESTKKKKGKKK